MFILLKVQANDLAYSTEPLVSRYILATPEAEFDKGETILCLLSGFKLQFPQR